jgi:hypothetical protein
MGTADGFITLFGQSSSGPVRAPEEPAPQSLRIKMSGTFASVSRITVSAEKVGAMPVEAIQARLRAASKEAWDRPASRMIILAGQVCGWGSVAAALLFPGPSGSVWFWGLVIAFGFGVSVLPILRAFDVFLAGSIQADHAKE